MIELREAGPCDSELAYCIRRAAFREYIEQVWGWSEVRENPLRIERQEHDRFGFRGEVGTVSALRQEALRKEFGGQE